MTKKEISKPKKGKVLTVKPKTGRPLKQLDENLIYELARVHVSQQDIARITDSCEDTINRRFQSALQRGYADANLSLKRKQFELAMSGNCSMLIWLGKQYLGQKDKSPEEVGITQFNVMVNEVPKA